MASLSAPSSVSQAVRSRILAWKRDPVLFAAEVLGLTLWDAPGGKDSQASVARAFVEHPLVACRSGQKTGKSLGAAALILWSVVLHSGWRVVFTAPAGHQVANVIWPELRALYLGARVPLGGRLYEVYGKGLKYREGWEAFGLTTNDAVKFAGLSSSGRLVLIIDEASGFPEELYDPVFGNLAGGGQVLLLGNPTHTAGTFYEAFHGKKGSWKTFHIPSTDTPNFRGGSVPGLATPSWLETVAKPQWGGPGSPAYDVRVLGEFPSQGSNAVVPLGLAHAAAARWEATEAVGRLSIGVDPARYGDDEIVLYPRRGKKALPPTALRSRDTLEIAGEALRLARELREEDEVPRVNVDTIGVGAGVYDVLSRSDEVEAVSVNVAEAATADGYSRLRDQLWFGLRDWLKEGGALPPDPKLEAELVAPTYTFDTQGRAKVSAKDELKKVLGRSPDRADALALSVYTPPSSAYTPAKARGARSR